MDILHTKINITIEYLELKNQLINSLDSIHMAQCKIPHRMVDEYRKMGKVINFGEGYRRHHGYGEYKANAKHPKTYELLKQFVAKIAPDTNYKVITVNRDVCMVKHLDKHNDTSSLFTCLGDFTGGGLVIYNPEPKLYQCKDCLIEFNGSKYEHETQPFQGRRYSLIIYSHKNKHSKEIDDMVKTSFKFSAIEEDLNTLEWKNYIKPIENSFIKGI